MSGASDLQLFETLVTNGNLLFVSNEDFVIIDGEAKPTLKKIYADFLASTGTFPTVADGLVATNGAGTSNRFFTVPETGDTFERRYRNDAGAAVQVGRVSSAGVVEALSGLIQAFSSAESEAEIAVIVDPEGGKHLTLTNKRLVTEAFEISNDGNALRIGDKEGAVAIYMDDERTLIGEFEMQTTSQPGCWFTDMEGGLLEPNGGESSQGATIVADPFEMAPLFSPVIATAEGYTQTLNVQSMLVKRELAPQVIGSIASTSTGAMETGSQLKIPAGRFGSAAVLNLRDVSKPSSRKIMNLQLKNVPVQTEPSSPKILIIGDSICNRQGGLFLKQILTGLGFTPTFIGTMNGSGVPNNAEDVTGELGEAREGWETGDFTNAITDRVIVVAPGDEETYKNMSKTEKWPRNPFLRAATGSDSMDIVRNGYVFDPAFYQARFALQTPDIVVNMTGTNNVRDRTDSTIYDSVLSDDTLMHNQIRAAWPMAKIIRSVPGTSLTGARNLLWTNRYSPMIKAMQQSAVDRADSKLTLAPIWALLSPEAGYSFTTGSVGADGFSTSDWADSVHPIQAARQALFEALAPYIAAAAINLI